MTQRADLGASIETSIVIAGRQPGLGAGTLGEYIRLEKPGEAPKICAMTCHHVTVSSDEPGKFEYTLFYLSCVLFIDGQKKFRCS